MAADGWVVDIIWHVMILAGNAVSGFWSSWSMEVLVGVSFLIQLVLTFSAGWRWSGASNSKSKARQMNIIWFFYVAADYVATTALGNFFASGGNRSLVAFWAPFFLLHLGGPDSITAYELEDNQLSTRYVLELVPRVAGALYIVYKYISGSWALVSAGWLMLATGVDKYVEKTVALYRANLDNLRRSEEKEQRRRHRTGSIGSHHLPYIGRGVDDNDDRGLVMKAHAFFYICKRSMVDSSVQIESDTDTAASFSRMKEALFELKWPELFRVMEIELSLMYDFLYTKAAVIHTWHGYSIRVLSPLATAASLLLVEREFSKEGGRHWKPDVVITRILLVGTFLLEMFSLLNALGSTWTCAFLQDLTPGWFRHHALCTGWWNRINRMVTKLGLLNNAQAHRRWSGSIGQLSVFQLVTRDRDLQSASKEQDGDRLWDEECQKYSEHIVIPPDVKGEVFDRLSTQLFGMRQSMKKNLAEKGEYDADMLKMAANMRTKRGQQALQENKLYDELRWSLGDELQLGILTWHIATDIYLLESYKDAEAKGETLASRKKVSSIKILSNYMMYLLAVRPDMLPGLVTRKLFELTCDDLAQLWSNHKSAAASKHPELSSSSSLPISLCNVIRAVVLVPSKLFFQLHNWWRGSPRPSSGREEQLVRLLSHYNLKEKGAAALNTYLSGGVELGQKLRSLQEKSGKKMLKVILEVWVEMLLYASYRCNKECHAKQLSCGGELTSIVWLMAEHVGLFIVRKTGMGDQEGEHKKLKDDKMKRRTANN